MAYIQILPAQQKMQRKILKKVFITKKFTQFKTWWTLKIDVFEIPDSKNIGKLFFSWINLIPFLILLR